MVCELCNANEEVLRRLTFDLEEKERTCNELNAKFSKHKLQSKAKVARLRQQIGEIAQQNGDDDSSEAKLAQMVLRLDESESHLSSCREQLNDFKAQLSERDTQIGDQKIKIKNLEDHLSAKTSLVHPEPPAPLESDAQKLYAQVVYKDTKLLELNSVLLEKERQIIDLMETIREKQQVAEAKTRAVMILQQQLQAFAASPKVDAATETSDMGKVSNGIAIVSSSAVVRSKESTPGGAVVIFPRRSSPPPNDPSEDRSSVTTETQSAATLDLGVLGNRDSNLLADYDNTDTIRLKKKRTSKKQKRVTFADSHPEVGVGASGSGDDGMLERIRKLEEQLLSQEQSLVDLTAENDELRSTIAELETICDAAVKAEQDMELQDKLYQAQIKQLKDETEEARKEGRVAALKSKAQLQSRVKDLEAQLDAVQSEGKLERDALQTENARLHLDLKTIQSENTRLESDAKTLSANLEEQSTALSAVQEENNQLRSALAESEIQCSALANELTSAQRLADNLLQQKQDVLDDAERLKEGFEASQLLIDSLEGDVEVAEAEVDQLREQLGEIRAERGDIAASLVKTSTEKKLKGKAFETKLKALEREKEKLNKESSGLKLKGKAYDIKLRLTEQEKLTVQQRLDQKTHECEGLLKEKDAIKTENSGLRFENNNLQSHIRQLTNDLGNLKHYNTSLLDEKQEIESTLQDLWNRETELKRQLAEMESDRTELRSEKSQLQDQYQELLKSEENITAHYNNLLTTNGQLEAAHHRLQDRCTELETGLTAENRSLGEELQSLRDRLTQAIAENDTMKQQISEKDIKNSDTLEDNRMLTAKVEDYSSKCQALLTNTAAQETELDSLKQQLSKIEAQMNDTKLAHERSNENHKTASDELVETREINEQLKQNWAELLTDLEATQQEANDLRSNSIAMEAAKNTLEEKVIELQTAMEKVSSDTNELQQALDAKIFEISTMREENAQLKSQLHEASNTTSDTTLVASTAADDVAALKAHVTELQEKNSSLQELVKQAAADLENKDAEMEQLVFTIQSQQHTNNTVNSEVQVDELSATIVHLQQTCSDLHAAQQSKTEELELLRISVTTERQHHEIALRENSANFTVIQNRLIQSEEQLDSCVQQLALSHEQVQTLQTVLSNYEKERMEVSHKTQLQKDESQTRENVESQAPDIAVDKRAVNSHSDLDELNENLKLQICEMGDKLRLREKQIQQLQEQLEEAEVHLVDSETSVRHSPSKSISEERFDALLIEKDRHIIYLTNELETLQKTAASSAQNSTIQPEMVTPTTMTNVPVQIAGVETEAGFEEQMEGTRDHQVFDSTQPLAIWDQVLAMVKTNAETIVEGNVAELSRLQMLINDLATELEMKERKIICLQQQVPDVLGLQQQLHQLSTELQIKTEEVQSLQDSFQQKNEDLDDEPTREELKAEIRQLTGQMQDLAEAYATASSDNVAYHGIDENLSSLQESMQDLQKMLAKQRLSIEEQQSLITTLHNNVEAQAEEITQLNTQMEQKDVTLNELTQKYQKSETINDELEKKVYEVEEEQNEIKNQFESKVLILQSEVEQSNTALQEVRNALETKQNELDVANEALAQKQPETVGPAKLGQLKQNYERAAKQLGKLKKKYIEKEEALKAESTKCQELSDSLNSANNQLEQQRKELSFVLQQHETAIDSLRSELEEKESNIVLRDSKIVQLQTDVNEQYMATKLVQEELQSTTCATSSEKGELHESLSKALSKASSLQQSLEATTADNEKLTEDRQNLCNEILKLNGVIQELKAEIEAQLIADEGVKISVDSLINENQVLKEKLDVVEGVNTERLETWNERVTLLEEENQLLRHCLNEANQTKQEDTEFIENLELEHTAQKGLIEDLKKELGNVQGKQCEAPEKDNEDQRLQKQIRQLEFSLQDSYVVNQDLIVTKMAMRSELLVEKIRLSANLEICRELKTNNDELLAQKTNVVNSYNELAQYYSQVQTAYATLYEQYQAITAKTYVEVETATEENSQSLETLHRNLSAAEASLEKFAVTVETSSKTNAELQRNADHWARERVEMFKKIQTLEQHNSKLKTQVDDLKTAHTCTVQEILEQNRNVKLLFDEGAAEIMSKRNEITELTSRMQQLETKLAQQTVDVELKEKELSETRDMCSKLQIQVLNIGDDIGKKQDEITELQQTLAKRDQSFGQLNTELDTRNKELLTLRESTTLITQEHIKSAVADETEQQKERLCIEEKIAQIEGQLSAATKRNTELEMALQSATSEKQVTKSEIDEYRQNIKKLTADNKAVTEQLSALKLQSEATDTTDMILHQTTQLSDVSAKFEHLKTNYDKLIVDYKTARSTIKEHEILVTTLKQENQQLETQMTSQEKQHRDLEAENKALRIQFDEVQCQVRVIGEVESARLEQEKELDLFTKCKDELIQKVKELELKCDRISLERRELVAKMSALQGELANVENEKASIRHELSMMVDELKVSCVHIEAERANLDRKLQDMQLRLDASEAERQAAQQLVIDMQKVVVQTESTASSEVGQLKNKVDEIRGLLDRVSGENAALVQQLEETCQTNSKLNEQLLITEKEIERSRMERCEVGEQRLVLESTLQTTITALEREKANHCQAVTQIDDCERTIQQLKLENSEAEKQWNGLKSDLADLIESKKKVEHDHKESVSKLTEKDLVIKEQQKCINDLSVEVSGKDSLLRETQSSLTVESERLTNIYNQIVIENGKLKEELAQLCHSREESIKIANEVDLLKGELSKANSYNSRSDQNLTNIQCHLEDAQEENKQLQTKMNELVAGVDERDSIISKQHETLLENENALADARNNTTFLEEKCTQLQAEYSALAQNVSKLPLLQTEIDHMNRTLSEQQSQYKLAETKVTSLETLLQETVTELQKSEADLQSCRQTQRTAEETAKAERKQVEQLTSEITENQADFEELIKAKQLCEQRYKEVLTQLEISTKKIDDHERMLAEKLEVIGELARNNDELKLTREEAAQAVVHSTSRIAELEIENKVYQETFQQKMSDNSPSNMVNDLQTHITELQERNQALISEVENAKSSIILLEQAMERKTNVVLELERKLIRAIDDQHLSDQKYHDLLVQFETCVTKIQEQEELMTEKLEVIRQVKCNNDELVIKYEETAQTVLQLTSRITEAETVNKTYEEAFQQQQSDSNTEDMINGLQTRLTEMQAENQNLILAVDTSSATNNNLQQSIDQKTSTIRELEGELSVATDNKHSSDQKYHDALQQLELCANKIQQQEQMLSEKSASVRQLSNNIELSRIKCDETAVSELQFKLRIAELENANVTYQEALQQAAQDDSVSNTVSDLQTHVSDTQAENSRLISTVEDATSANRHLQQQLDENASSIGELESKLSTVTEQHQTTLQQLKKAKVLAKKYDKIKTDYKYLESANKQLMENQDALDMEKHRISDECAELSLKLSYKAAEAQSLQENFDKLTEIDRQNRQQLEKSQEDYSTLADKNSQLQERLQNQESLIEQTESNKVTMQSQIDALQIQTVQLQEEKESLGLEVDELQAALTTMVAERNTMRKEGRELSEKLETEQASVSQLTEARNEMQKELRETENTVGKLREELVQLRSARPKLVDGNTDAQTQTTVYAEVNEELREKVENLEWDNDTLSQSNETLQTEITQLKEQVANVTAETAEKLQSLQEQNDLLTTDQRNNQTALTDTQQRYSALCVEVFQLVGEVDTADITEALQHFNDERSTLEQLQKSKVARMDDLEMLLSTYSGIESINIGNHGKMEEWLRSVVDGRSVLIEQNAELKQLLQKRKQELSLVEECICSAIDISQSELWYDNARKLTTWFELHETQQIQLRRLQKIIASATAVKTTELNEGYLEEVETALASMSECLERPLPHQSELQDHEELTKLHDIAETKLSSTTEELQCLRAFIALKIGITEIENQTPLEQQKLMGQWFAETKQRAVELEQQLTNKCAKIGVLEEVIATTTGIAPANLEDDYLEAVKLWLSDEALDRATVLEDEVKLQRLSASSEAPPMSPIDTGPQSTILQAELEGRSRLLDEMRVRMTDLQQRYDTAVRQNYDAKAAADTMISAIDQRLQAALSDKRQLDMEMANVKLQCERVAEEKSALLIDKEQLETALNEAKERLQTGDDEAAAVYAECEALQEEREALNERLISLTTLFEECEKDRVEARSVLRQISNDYGIEADEIHERLQNLMNECDALEREKREFDTISDRYKEQLATNDTHVEQCNTEIMRLTKALDETTNEMQQAKLELNSVKSVEEDLKRQPGTTRSEVIELKTQLGERNASLAKLKDENSSLNGQLTETQEAIIMLQQKVHGYTKQVELLSEENQNLQQRLTTNRTEKCELSKAIETRDDAVRLVGELREQVAQNDRRLATAKLKMAEKEVFVEQLNELQKHTEVSDNERQQLQETIEQLRTNVAEAKADLELSERERSVMQDQVQSTTEQWSSAVSDEALLRQHLSAQLEAMQRQTEILEREKQQLQTQLEQTSTIKTGMAVSAGSSLWGAFGDESDDEDPGSIEPAIEMEDVPLIETISSSATQSSTVLPASTIRAAGCLQNLRRRCLTDVRRLRRVLTRRGAGGRMLVIYVKWLLFIYLLLLHLFILYYHLLH